MCGRYALYGPKSRSTEDKRDLADADRALVMRFVEEFLERAAPRYNIAPQQGNPKAYVPIVRKAARGELEVVMAQWWLLPYWAKERRIKFMTFNARIETAQTLASFRESFRRRRCLVPASGWYEWQELASGNLPWFIRPLREEPLLFAGLWDRWEKGGETVESCSIIVGPANAAIQAFHDRMPYTVTDVGAWLDPGLTDAMRAAELLAPIPAEAIAAHRVSRRVNSARIDDVGLTEPLQTTE